MNKYIMNGLYEMLCAVPVNHQDSSYQEIKHYLFQKLKTFT